MASNVSYRTPEDEQNKLLERARQIVKEESMKMKSFLDKGERTNGMKHALVMLCELHTSLLSPKKYFELYIETTEHLRHLHSYIINEMESGRKVSDLYEYVQYTGNIVPRLYLLITVGTVYIRTREAASKRILHDLVEMCRGVQHPLRGLFLRNYLLQMTKDHLPDGKNSNPEYGTVVNSIDFVLMNFAEMNKLWVRMQHQGHTRDRQKREQERRELCILVGTNLERISQLDDITVELYKEKVLPMLLRQSVLCKDRIAQEYLMEGIIQVFPDEFHLKTLDAFLDSCKKLHESVNVQRIVCTLMDRLAKYRARQVSNDGSGDAEPEGEASLFDIFSKQVKELEEARPEMPLADIVSLYVSCTELALQFYPDRLDYADRNFKQVLDILSKKEITGDVCSREEKASKQIKYLLNVPLSAFANPLRVLDLAHFADMMKKLAFYNRKDTATSFSETFLQRNAMLNGPEAVKTFLEVIAPLVVDQSDATEADEQDDENFMDDQCMVAKIITRINCGDNLSQQLACLQAAKKQFFEGGERRIKVTLPALVFKALRLASDFANQEEENDWEPNAQQALKLVQQTIQKLKEDNGELAMMLSLQAVLVADECDFDTIAYEFYSQAFELFEEDGGLTSNDQVVTFPTLVGTLQQTSCFTEENFVLLATKCAQVPATKILKKQEQCRALCTVAYIFWRGQYRKSEDDEEDEDDNKEEDDDDEEVDDVRELKNAKRVMECIKKALKLATNATDHKAQLFVEVLNHCIGFFEDGCDSITAEFINRLMGLAARGLEEATDGNGMAETKAYFESTKAFVKQLKESEEAAGNWAEIEL